MPTGNEPMPPMAKWLASLVGLMIIFGIINSTSKKVEVPATYNQPSPSYNAPQPPQAPALLEPLYESIPPVGSGQLLNFVQLRFCIGERIRLDALDVFGRNNVNRYNTKVKFFNDRCSSYRYKVTDFNSVTQDMQNRKDLLAQQARLDWFKADELERKSKAKAAKPNLAKPATELGADTTTPSPFPKPAHQIPRSNGMPLNAKLDYTGTGWVCVNGYRQHGNECAKIELTPNAIIDYLGSDWTCKRGFQKRSSECIAVDITKNAVLDYLGSDWTCKRGFQKRSNECVTVDTPQNANLDYLCSDWTCKRVSGSEAMDAKSSIFQRTQFLTTAVATGHVNVVTDTHPILVSRCKFRLTPTSITWGATGLATPAIAKQVISVSPIRPGHHEHIHTLALQVIGAQL